MPSSLVRRDHHAWAATRLVQVEQLLIDKCANDLGLINIDEAHTAIQECGAALGAHLANPVAASNLGSSSCWAVLLCRARHARRPGGWCVDTVIAQDSWSARTIHAQIQDFAGERFNGTAAGETSAKRRRLRLDTLGDDDALKLKARTLHRLLRIAGREGLPDPILDLELPTVMSFNAAHRARMAREEAVASRWAQRLAVKQAASQAAREAAAAALAQQRALLRSRGSVDAAASGAGMVEVEEEEGAEEESDDHDSWEAEILAELSVEPPTENEPLHQPPTKPPVANLVSHGQVTKPYLSLLRGG
jgi:hypothetical protein